jgi:hypothetical protein
MAAKSEISPDYHQMAHEPEAPVSWSHTAASIGRTWQGPLACDETHDQHHIWATGWHVITRVSRLKLRSAKCYTEYHRLQAEKEELVALKNSAPEVDADEESRARLAALRGEDAGPKKAVDMPFRTAQVRAITCIP